MVFAILSTAFLPSYIFASEIRTDEEIPEIMEPNSVITYIDDHTYVINRGGEIEKEDSSITLKSDKFLEIAKSNGSYNTANTGELPKPVKGLSLIHI